MLRAICYRSGGFIKMVENNSRVIKQIKKYIHYIDKNYHIKKIIMFGSYAKGVQNDSSDVDLAIVASEFGNAPLLEKMKLYELRAGVDLDIDIQPIPFGESEFYNNNNFFISEIINTGIDITGDVVNK